jgi:hypothetical protein
MVVVHAARRGGIDPRLLQDRDAPPHEHGQGTDCAISPDGRYVVHDDGNFDRPGLWIRQVSVASSVQIAPPARGRYTDLAFTPDGDAVLYVFSAADALVGSLFRIPALGGVSRKVVDEITTPGRFLPMGHESRSFGP